MNGYFILFFKNILEKQSSSKVKMGRGLPVYKKLPLQFMQIRNYQIYILQSVPPFFGTGFVNNISLNNCKLNTSTRHPVISKSKDAVECAYELSSVQTVHSSARVVLLRHKDVKLSDKALNLFFTDYKQKHKKNGVHFICSNNT